jgi:uncharacterized protein (TIGR03086 family)
MDAIELYERAATHAAGVARHVTDVQRGLPTPCSEWDVAGLLEHMGGGAAYLLDALGANVSPAASWPEESAVKACVSALREPGALERRCMSPAGFEWSAAEAAAGTAMDQLIHTWDLAVAIDGARELDADAVETIVTMFVPMMPEVGRQAGFVGPEVAVPSDAPAQDRLLGAMGRDPHA